MRLWDASTRSAPGVKGLRMGERVGIPSLGHTCGICSYCIGHRENLCDDPLFTGFIRDGGFATATIVEVMHLSRRYCAPA